MIKGKAAYLKRLTSKIKMPSVDIGKELDGSTPPSVFIGSWNYPKVLCWTDDYSSAGGYFNYGYSRSLEILIRKRRRILLVIV